MSSRSAPAGVPFPKPSKDSFVLESKYQQQHHNPHSKYSESYFDQQPASNQDYSIGVPVFTPGKEGNYNSGFADSTSQQKTPLKSSSKNVYFQDNKHDIKPLSFVLDTGNGSGNGETKDIIPPQQQFRGDIVPDMTYSDSNPRTHYAVMSPQRSRSPELGRHRAHTSEDFTPTAAAAARGSSPAPRVQGTSPSPFVKESIWPDYQNADFSTKNDTTYDIAKSTVNRPDSNVAPILRRDVPEDEGEFMSYLEDFQKEIRHLQVNTAHNKGV